MAGPSAIQHNKSWLHKWFAPNSGTHWSVAGAVVVILLGSYLVGSYLVYSNHTTATPIAAAEQTSAPMALAPPAPLNSQK
jgi:hypothetical protein